MKLLDEMFHVISDDGRQTVLRLNEAHPIYAIHFPGTPITPGVCIVQLLGELLARRGSCDMELVRIVNLKYVQTITPEGNPLLTVDFSSVAATAEGIHAKGTMSLNGQVATKFSLIFREKQS